MEVVQNEEKKYDGILICMEAKYEMNKSNSMELIVLCSETFGDGLVPGLINVTVSGPFEKAWFHFKRGYCVQVTSMLLYDSAEGRVGIITSESVVIHNLLEDQIFVNKPALTMMFITSTQLQLVRLVEKFLLACAQGNFDVAMYTLGWLHVLEKAELFYQGTKRQSESINSITYESDDDNNAANEDENGLVDILEQKCEVLISEETGDNESISNSTGNQPNEYKKDSNVHENEQTTTKVVRFKLATQSNKVVPKDSTEETTPVLLRQSITKPTQKPQRATIRTSQPETISPLVPGKIRNNNIRKYRKVLDLSESALDLHDYLYPQIPRTVKAVSLM